MGSVTAPSQKKKVVFITGSTGSGKSRLSIDIATHFFGEVINSDKMQVYKGLDIITNTIAESDRRGVPHHLIREVEPNGDFTSKDFCMSAISAIDRIVALGRVPIIVGGSNSFVEALVENPSVEFNSRYEACFIWLTVAAPVRDSYLSKRVDEMVMGGLVEEVKAIFAPNLDYNGGIYRSIGVPEMDAYLRAERMADFIEFAGVGLDIIDRLLQQGLLLYKGDCRHAKVVGGEVGVGLHLSDQVVRHASMVGLGDFVGDDVQFFVDLHFDGVNDLAEEMGGDVYG